MGSRARPAGASVAPALARAPARPSDTHAEPTFGAAAASRTGPGGAGRAAEDPQALLLADIVSHLTRDPPSLPHLLDLLHQRLDDALGLTRATVFTRDPDDGTLTPVAGPAGDAELALAAGTTPPAGAQAVDTTRLALPLRASGRDLGVLVLAGTGLDELRPDVLAPLALHIAGSLLALGGTRERRFNAHAADVIRRMFEEGTAASSVEEAGRILARATAEAFRTEYAAVNLVDADGLIRHAIGVNVAEDVEAELRRKLIGKVAGDSPVWRATAAAGGPLLVGDVASEPGRAGGFVQTLGVRSYIAMPLLSATGPVGMVMCGDASRTREWTSRDRALADRLAVEGALIVDSARLRAAEREHLAELTRQAYHDSLTGLPNRSHLVERAELAIARALAERERLALLLLDLDGFKGVNDSYGHHAGDALLQAVGERLVGALREQDLVARLGGDEFAILLARDPDERTATAIARRIHDRLAEPYEIEGRPVRIGASIGIALMPDHAAGVSALLRGADVAMYQAKRGGGGVRVTA